MIKYLLPVLLFGYCTVSGQVIDKRTPRPGIASITTQYFDSRGKQQHWSFEKVDANGRIVERMDYRRKILVNHFKFIYNEQGDLTYELVEHDLSHPDRKDTTRYYYQYDSGRIVYQKCVFPNLDSTVHRLISHEQDSVLVYRFTTYNKTRSYDKMRTITFRNGILVKYTEGTDSAYQTVSYEFYPNGKHKRRMVTRVPPVTNSGRGADDILYEYDYDENGRVKVYYVTIDGRRSKAATYEYVLR